MATPEIKPEDILLGPANKARDNAQLFVTDEVVKGLVIAPKLGFASTEDKRVNWFTRDKTSKEQFDENLIMQPLPSEKGELIQVSGMELTPNSERVKSLGYMYTVDKSDLEDSPESYLMDIQDLVYGLTEALETDAGAALIANASASSFTPLDGNWDDSTTVAKDIRGYKSEYNDRDIRGALSDVFLNGTNYDELGNYIIDTEGIAQLKEETRGSVDVITYAGLDFSRTAIGVSEGSILGIDKNLTPGFIKYRSIPGAYKPIETKPGTEQYTPVINMKVEDTEERRMEPVRTFKFSMSWRTAITRPRGILYDTGI